MIIYLVIFVNSGLGSAASDFFPETLLYITKHGKRCITPAFAG